MQENQQQRIKRPPNRFERRAHASEKANADRREARHWCILDARTEAAGVRGPVGLTLSEWHDVHKALGEAVCPRCSRCSASTRHPVVLGRQAALARFRAALGEARAREIGVEAFAQHATALPIQITSLEGEP